GLPLELEGPFVRASHELAHQVRVFPGVVDMLTGLRAGGVGLCVATGKSGERARSLLDTMGLAEFFSAVVGSDEVPRPKPAADIVVEALVRVGGLREAAVMVGDAVADLRSARAAGVVPIAATWGEGDPAELAAEDPAWILDDPGDLLSVAGLPARGREPVACLGIDIGGSGARLQLVPGPRDGDRSPKGSGPVEERLVWSHGAGVEEDLAHLVTAVGRVTGGVPERVDALGVARPTSVDAEGTVTAWPNRPAWVGCSFPVALTQLCPGVPATHEDDGNAAARAEAAAAGASHLVYLGIGTGLAGGIVADGQVVAGA